MDKIQGIIDHIKFENKDNGWTILELITNPKTMQRVTVNIVQVGLEDGLLVEFSGLWTEHPKFGKQFKGESYILLEPNNLELLQQYLGGDKMIRYVGPITAKSIIDHFGDETLDILNNNIERLVEVKGITEDRIVKIKEDWNKGRENRETVLFLQSLGLSVNLAVKIFNLFGNETKNIVTKNPYAIIDEVEGLHFKQMDLVAKQLGFKDDCVERIYYGFTMALKKARVSGHCCVPQEELVDWTVENLNLEANHEFVEDYLSQLVESSFFKVVENGRKFIYLKNIYEAEKSVAKRVLEISSIEVDKFLEDIDAKIQGESYLQDIELSKEQHLSIKQIVNSPFSILTGSAGSGKTTTVKLLVKILTDVNKSLILAAPTGRAAQRMMEVTGFESKTIHRLLHWDVQEGKFHFNKNNPLKGDFLIVDESSMIDIKLMHNLLLAVPQGCQVLLIGDPNQLPPVEEGNPLVSLIESKVVPVLSLTQIYRQKQSSKIINYAQEIINQKMPSIESPLKNPDLFKLKQDCLFIESMGANNEQIKYLNKVKKIFFERYKPTVKNISFKMITRKDRLGQLDLEVPSGYSKWDFNNLSEAQLTKIDKSLENMSPDSSLFWGQEATSVIEKLYSSIIPKYYGSLEVQILAPMKKGPLGVNNLNLMIQKKINPRQAGMAQLQIGEEKFLRQGDKVIQLKNNYELNVFNGDIGYVESIDEKLKKVQVYFSAEDKYVNFEKEDLKHLDLAYAITIHKSQGSEFDAVIIPFATQHFMMLYNNLLYTAITRGKKLVVFVGEKKALALASHNKKTNLRYTNLDYFLKI